MKFNPLTPRWQHQDPKVRIQAIQDQDLNEEVLQGIVAQDEDNAVQVAALAKIQDAAWLQEFSAESADARQRWAELIGSDLKNLPMIANLTTEFLNAIARHATKEEFRLGAVDRLEEEALCQLLREDNLSKVHQHCAALIESEDKLMELQKLFVDKDKNVSRLLKGKIQAIKHDREQAETKVLQLQNLSSRAQSLKQSLEQSLSLGEPEADYRRRLDALRVEWQQLPDSRSEAASEIQQTLTNCSEIIDLLPNPAEQQAAQIKVLEDRLNQLHSQCVVSNSVLDSLSSELIAIRADWPKGLDQNDSELINSLSQLADANQSWQQFLAKGPSLELAEFTEQLKQLSWPDGFPEPTEFINQAEAIQAKLKTAADELAKAQAFESDLIDSLDKLEAEIGQGHIKAANRASVRVSKLIKENAASSEHSGRATLLQNQLQDLKDWQGFATQPKRDDLCKQMEVLANDQDIAVLEKAKAIKELQTAWKELGASDSRAAQKSWGKFKTLGDQAYAPVAQHFDEQQKIREEHLSARANICDEIETFERDTDWDAADFDWKSLASFLQSHHSKWHQHGNVPRRNKKAIEKRYHNATAPLRDRLKTAQARHIEQKEALIQSLKAKFEDDTMAVSELINTAKSAQQAWRQIGFVDRRKDQKLWKAFRSQCDAVFAKRDTEKTSEQNAAREVADAYRATCKTFSEKISGAFERKDIASFRKEIGEFDLGKGQRGLDREAKKLISEAEHELKQRARQNEELMFREFQRRNQLMDEGQEVTEADLNLSDSFQAALEARTPRDEAAQDLLLIRLEILSDLPSPETSQNARMGYQVERLNRELSKGQKETRSEREQVRDLLTEWFTTSNKLAELEPRFKKIAGKLGLAV